MSSDDQLLTRALGLAQRRDVTLQRLRGNPNASSDLDLKRLTSSLKMAVDTLLMAYQEEARNSPWYTFSAVKREAGVEAASAPHKAAQSASRQARDIIKDAETVLAEKKSDDALNAGIFLIAALSLLDGRSSFDWDQFEDPAQRIAGRLRQLQYDLLNSGLPLPELSAEVATADMTELILSDQDGGAHSAWIENWYDSVAAKGLDLPRIIRALQAWLPAIDQAATPPDVAAAQALAIELEQRVMLAAIDRLPLALRAFAKT